MQIFYTIRDLIFSNDRDPCVEEPMVPDRMLPASVKVTYIINEKWLQSIPPTHYMSRDHEGIMRLRPIEREQENETTQKVKSLGDERL